MERMKSNKISLFWHRTDKIMPINDSVAIQQIANMEDVDEGMVVFRCKPTAEEFMFDPWGYIEVRYDCLPFDNPNSGELLCTIKRITPILLAVDDLTMLDAENDNELEFIMRTESYVTWEFIRERIDEYKNDEED